MIKPPRRHHPLRALALALLCALGTSTSHAANRALLVGVSAYPHLLGKDLPGVANDVALMGQVAAKLGFAPQHVTRLSEEPGDALPTRAHIVGALATLAEQAQPGDWVLVYLSGHGAQVPVRRGSHSTEADGLDEVFLPRDTQAWQPARQLVKGALRDKDIGAALRRIQAKGANVWAVFDTCHAADMTRRPSGIGAAAVWRFASPADLQIPLSMWLDRWQHSLRGKGDAASVLRVSHPAGRKLGGDFVGFYAAEQGEGSLEERLPDPAEPTRQRAYGLFTYQLAQAVHGGWSGSFAALAEAIKRGYADRPFPNPQFVGALSQRPMFVVPPSSR